MTRRQLTLLAGGIGITPAMAQTSRPGTTIHQEIDFTATRARIYQVLLDAKQFAAFSRQAAEIQPQPGAAFKLFGGRITGRNIELIPDQRIVQAWRPESWAPGIYSIVRFELAAHGTGTRVVLDHAGFAEDKWEGLNRGWAENYWEPLRKFLAA
jgi:activator of HSP90 ATPase